MNKIISFTFLPAFLATLVVGGQVFAQNIGVSGGGSASAGVSTGATGNAIISPEPITPPTGGTSGFVQFNNLTVESVSGASAPAEITAYNGYGYPPPPTPVMGGASVNSMAVPVTPSITSYNCFSYSSPSAGGGSAIPCPIPPGTATGTSPSSVGGSAGSGSTGNGAIAYPIRAPYRIEVSAQTELMLRDRSVASLSDFSNGDQINVFGYYNTDGSIQAYIVRDISKPVETETMQLNNVTLVSVSGTNLPATLAVTQTVGAPCYGFNGSVKSNIACPMGVSSFSQNSATADVQPPPSVAPMWMMLRKYVVTVDARTIILDSNRNIIPLSSLNVNDSLNVYGESTDNGQTITADIVRDTSIPVAQTSFGGTVTQVNSDGSFVIQTKDGQTLTIASPVSVGESVSVTGIQSQGTITQITRLTVSTSTPNPVPGPLPMMRIQGSSYPTSSNGKPINY